MSFNLDDYKKKPIRNVADEIPEWVSNGPDSNRTLYSVVVKSYVKVNNLIESGAEPGIKDRKIVLSRIAKEAGVDKSLVSSRRKPELVDFINVLNAKLELAWHKSKKRKNVSGSKINKDSLIVENKRLKSEIKHLKQANMKAYFEAAIEHELLESSRQTYKELATYKSLYSDSLDIIENLRGELRKLTIKRIQ